MNSALFIWTSNQVRREPKITASCIVPPPNRLPKKRTKTTSSPRKLMGKVRTSIEWSAGPALANWFFQVCRSS
jgi:hypothetical protein